MFRKADYKSGCPRNHLPLSLITTVKNKGTIRQKTELSSKI